MELEQEFEQWYRDTMPTDCKRSWLYAAFRAGARVERETCAMMAENYTRETGDMVARGCLMSVAYDIRERSNVQIEGLRAFAQSLSNARLGQSSTTIGQTLSVSTVSDLEAK